VGVPILKGGGKILDKHAVNNTRVTSFSLKKWKMKIEKYLFFPPTPATKTCSDAWCHYFRPATAELTKILEKVQKVQKRSNTTVFTTAFPFGQPKNQTHRETPFSPKVQEHRSVLANVKCFFTQLERF
jgi:hypothetical protein